MTVYVAGGSNSLLPSGWTRRIHKLFAGDAFENISIGATNSITGLFRAMFTIELNAGDTILWEYALNDINHVEKRGLSAAHLLRYVETLLAFCAERKVNFVALLFVSGAQEARGAEPGYKARLRALFDSWQVAYVDVPGEYRQVLGESPLPPECFEVAEHYATAHPIIDYIECRAVELLGARSVPVKAARLYSDPQLGMGYLDRFRGGARTLVGTRLFRAPGWRPDPVLEVTAPSPGVVVGAMVFAARHGGGLVFEAGDARTLVSATLPGNTAVKARLSPSYLKQGTADPLGFEAGDTICIRWATEAGTAISGGLNKRRLSQQDIDGRASFLMGLLVEVPGGLGSEAAARQ